MKITVLLLVLFLLTGCAANQSTPIPTVTNSQPIQNTQEFITPYKVFTPTYNTLITSSPINKPTSTNTQSAFLIHPPTQTPFPDFIELPEWLKTSKNDDLFMALTGITDNGLILSVINPSTQQQFNIPISRNPKYFWSSDGTSINIVNPDWKLMTIDIHSGKVKYAVLDKNPFRFSPWIFDDNTLTPLIASGFLDQLNFILLQPYESRRISFDSIYMVEVNTGLTEEPISVINIETGEVTPITSPNDGIYEVEYAWSPMKDQLAILQSRLPPQLYYWPGDHIIIYDIDKKSVTSSFNGDFSYISWSSDGQQLLYRKSSVEGERGFYYSNSPCVINIQSGMNKCYYTIKFQTDSVASNAFASGFDWFPGDLGITYLLAWTENSIDKGNFCIYYFKKDSITCPTQGLEDLSKRAVVNYDMSPSGEYVILNYDLTLPESDYRERVYTSLIKIDGTGYLRLWTEKDYQKAGEIKWDHYYDNLLSYGVLWRPVVP
jgi:hypothetical protein